MATTFMQWSFWELPQQMLLSYSILLKLYTTWDAWQAAGDAVLMRIQEACDAYDF